MTKTSHESGVERVCRSVTGLVLLTLQAVGLAAACHTEQASRGGDSTSRAAASISAASSVALTAPVAPVEAPSGGAGSSPLLPAAPPVPSSAVAISPTTRVAGGKATTSTGPSGSASAAEPSASASAPGLPTASVAPPVVRRRGPVASSESYETWLETTGTYSPGTAASVVVVLSAKAPFKCNTQYPYKLTLDAPPSGVTYASSVARGMQVDGKHASMIVPFTPSRPGTVTIGGTLSFSTCTADRCLVDKARISVPIDVR